MNAAIINLVCSCILDYFRLLLKHLVIKCTEFMSQRNKVVSVPFISRFKIFRSKKNSDAGEENALSTMYLMLEIRFSSRL